MGCEAGNAARAFLEERGIRPGASLVVVAAAPDSLLVQVEVAHVSLARALAEAINVTRQDTA